MNNSTPNPPAQIEPRRGRPNFWVLALAPAIALIASYEYILPPAVSWGMNLPTILGGLLVFAAAGAVVPFGVALLENLVWPVVTDLRRMLLFALPVFIVYLCAFTAFIFFFGILAYLFPGDTPTSAGPIMTVALITLPLDVLAALLVAGAGWLGSRIRQPHQIPPGTP